ncbi:MAG: hypothetical protein N3B12_09390, partial [Armatimonadetes bacterium]|nr:hypothetical protein [Armatimonadota bacterium]
RSGQTIELATNRSLDVLGRERAVGKSFDVAIPAWDPNEAYENRVIGTAALRSLDKKIVLQMTSFNPGWSMSDIQIGFDIYESLPPKEEK